ncbi:MAG: uracil-DNA glycosylase [Candidatus Marinimicrobia bacterium]|nr:uracil-DNA glycosylase [Candidatus Neomarinimicrobiota bacterium]
MIKAEKLDEIAKRVTKCTRCDLYKRATKAVPGDGNPEAEVIFLGEGPGYHEDLQGLPFVGAAGQLLDQLLQSIKLKRNDIFIGNVIKHRPPDNRDPLPEEIEACRPFLDEQIQIIAPKMIITLGRFSLNKFLPNEKISQIHGQARYVDFLGRQYMVLPMYHPAAALRSGRIMEEIKEDFQKVSLLLEEKPKLETEKAKEENQQMKLIE